MALSRELLRDPVPAVTSLTIGEAAALLQLSPKQLRRAIRRGAPVVVRGHKGRGHKTLVRVDEVRRWLDNRDPAGAPHFQLAEELIREVAATIALQFRMASGPHKAAMLAASVDTFLATAAAIRRQLGLPPLDPADVPAEIQQMARAAVHFSRSGILPDSRKENL